MDSRPFPDIPCLICGQALDLKTDLSADENGKAVHTECYVKHIGAGLNRQPARTK